MGRRTSRFVAALFGAISLVAFASVPGCGGSNNQSGFGSSSGGGGGSGSNGSGSGNSGSGGSNSGGSGSGSFGSTSSGGSGGNSDGGVACPSGLQCNVSCSGGTTTTISGKVYDPAGNDPLYNIAVYVPAVPLVALPQGVPTGSDACNCAALFKSGAVVSTVTGVDGSFKLSDAPVGSNVPLVLQVGKWRRLVKINVTSCQDNPQPDKSLTLPSTVASGDTDDNMPDIAVSTGSADSLECLMHRIGLPLSEYSGGAGGAGHIHVFAGGGTGGGGFGGGAGRPESPAWANATPSDTTLWDSQAHLMPYDITLLSCEGGETYNADPSVLEQYLNAGGRAFGSHFHYAWFSGPLGSGQSYSAPADWGNNLATWSANGTGGGLGGTAMGNIVQTLNGSTQPFAKGVALYQWLGLNGALTNMQLPIQQPRYNAVVGAANKPSQPWIQDSASPNTMYFSFDTPVNAPPNPDGGPPSYCGRAVFSDLHVSGATTDPGGTCNDGMLSPQEKALEFMLFDLSSCVIPDTIPPSDAGIPIAN